MRLGIYLRAVRPYARAVTCVGFSPETRLPVQHDARVRCAEKHLPLNPLVDYGLLRLIDDARAAVAELVNPAALAWLPDVREHCDIAAE